jgi:SAM-dependent methyltransferase
VTASPAPGASCWVCGSQRLELAKAGNAQALSPEAFAITDSHYGTTGELWRCLECGFLECPDLGDALRYYEDLEDAAYEEGREQRALQMRKLLGAVRAHRPAGRLLDVGAGSGILTEQALALGYQAEGIEPSRWLQARARERRLPVHLGTLPHASVSGPFDVVMLIDVLEHVPQPVALLGEVRRLLHPSGVAAIVTPDLGSLAARLTGFRWWHFRVAHIGYFDRSTLERALAGAGLRLLELRRPAWYFSADYLLARVNRYLPAGLRLPVPRALRRLTLPLNLGDSMLAICAPVSAAQGR